MNKLCIAATLLIGAIGLSGCMGNDEIPSQDTGLKQSNTTVTTTPERALDRKPDQTDVPGTADPSVGITDTNGVLGNTGGR